MGEEERGEVDSSDEWKRNWIHRSFDWMGISSERSDELVRVDISS